MKKNSYFLKCAAVALVAMVAFTMLFTSCDNSQKLEIKREESREQIEKLISEGKFDECMAVIDSLEQTKVCAPEMACFYRANIHYYQGDVESAENSYRQGIEAGKKEVSSQMFYISCY